MPEEGVDYTVTYIDEMDVEYVYIGEWEAGCKWSFGQLLAKGSLIFFVSLIYFSILKI